MTSSQQAIEQQRIFNQLQMMFNKQQVRTQSNRYKTNASNSDDFFANQPQMIPVNASQTSVQSSVVPGVSVGSQSNKGQTGAP